MLRLRLLTKLSFLRELCAFYGDMLKKAEVPQQEMELVAIESLVPFDHLLRKIHAAIELDFIRERVRPSISCCSEIPQRPGQRTCPTSSGRLLPRCFHTGSAFP